MSDSKAGTPPKRSWDYEADAKCWLCGGVGTIQTTTYLGKEIEVSCPVCILTAMESDLFADSKPSEFKLELVRRPSLDPRPH